MDWLLSCRFVWMRPLAEKLIPIKLQLIKFTSTYLHVPFYSAAKLAFVKAELRKLIMLKTILFFLGKNYKTQFFINSVGVLPYRSYFLREWELVKVRLQNFKEFWNNPCCTSRFFSSKPKIVNVFLEPVWPYANMHTLYPSTIDCTKYCM